MIDKQQQGNERKIIKQSHPFKSAKSEAIFRLVETDGGMQIEKVTTTVVVERTIDSPDDPDLVFAEFLELKQANRERSKKRIDVNRAIKLRYEEGLTNKQIAEDFGSRSPETVSKMINETLKPLAYAYMNGADIYDTAKRYDLSPNQMHEVLVEKLRLRRSALLDHYARQCSTHLSYEEGTGGDTIRKITTFLDEWEHVDFIVVSPFQGEPSNPTNKNIIYDEQFREVRFKSGRKQRYPYHYQEYFEQHFSPADIIAFTQLVANEELIGIYDMFGNREEFIEEAFLEAAATLGGTQA
ncbi:MAG: hypothetical protein ACRBBO_02665 [Cognatishimia sp.]